MTTNVVHIPATAEAAVEELGSLGRLINARKWERAAIVASLVGPAPGSGRQDRKNPISGFSFTLRGLADQGITGLRKPDTIAHYRDVWCRQRPAPAFGESVDLTDLPEWPGIPEEELAQHTGMTPERKQALQDAGKAAGMPTGAKVVDVAANPKALRAAILADQGTADAALKALNERGTRTPSPEHKAFEAQMKARNDVSEYVVEPVLRAAVMVQQAVEVYDKYERDMTEADREQMAGALLEIEVAVGALRMHLTLEDQET